MIRLLLTQNILFTTIRFILGVPLGFNILNLIWSSSRTSFYVVPSLTLTNIILSATITFSLSILINLMFSNKIKNLKIVESLKYSG